MSSNSDIQPIMTVAREAAGLGAGRPSSSSEEDDSGSGSHGRAPGACPETANAEHQRLTPADDDVADAGASSANACSIAVFPILADAVDVKRDDQLCETVSQPSIQPDKVVGPMGS